MHDTLQVHDSLLIKTSVDLASDSLWQYSEIQGDDTLELAIDARTGELQYLNIFSPISEKEHSVAPDVKPVFPSSESYLKPFSLHYSLSAARDLFNPYWEAQANAELYLFGGVGVMSSAQYQYDGLFTQSRHTARLLVGALYHFQ
jgi:hypothetical protein